MYKGLVFLFIISLMSLTVGVSYRVFADYSVLVLAEEEERSSEQSLDEHKINLSSARLYQPQYIGFFRDDSANEKYNRPYRMFWSSANINIHDIPPEQVG